MADHCSICDCRRPDGGTNHLVLNGGQVWIEFCVPCGEKEILTNPAGERVTVGELFRAGMEGREPVLLPREEPEPETFGSFAHLL